MTPAEVLDFVRAGPTTSRLSYPEVGWQLSAYPVFGGIADGQKLVLVMAGSPFTVAGGYVLSAVQLSDDQVVVSIDKTEPVKQILLQRIAANNLEALKQYEISLNEYDEGKVDSDAPMRGVMETLEPPPTEKPYRLDYVEWAKFDEFGEVSPRGIIAVAEDGSKLTAIPFPGHENEALRWIRWESIGPRVLEELPDLAGADTFISGVISVNGVDWDDASNIAIFRYGATQYAKTGRSLFA